MEEPCDAIDRDRPAIYYLPPIRVGDSYCGQEISFARPAAALPCDEDAAAVTCAPVDAPVAAAAIVEARITRPSGGQSVYLWSTADGNARVENGVVILDDIAAIVTADFEPGLCVFELRVTTDGIAETIIDRARVAIRGLR